LESGQVHAAARTLGLEVALRAVKRAEDFAPVIDALKGQAEALYIVENALIGANGAIVITRALDAQLPTTFLTRDLVKAGGLMSYGPNIPDQFRYL
jgi:putative tryptophan/tyrosine transport system substrate-binding protein